MEGTQGLLCLVSLVLHLLLIKFASSNVFCINKHMKTIHIIEMKIESPRL